jgi:hypothetical protein
MTTYHVALPFIVTDDGIAPGDAAECQTAEAAIVRAEALSRTDGYVGAVAFSRTGDPDLGRFEDAIVHRVFGDLPTMLAMI